ncbi:MAG: hypothetical protein A4E49_00045 [Methanosaeta sp. PtaU1.Bin112]|nr:MAG: hypothetical protein A4E49_00045 [Methanosaeta sp. PtaU1.Bin112]
MLPGAGPRGKLALKHSTMHGGYDPGIDMEEVLQGFSPLLTQIPRADYKNPRCQIPGHQLGNDKTGFDGLSQAHVVSDHHSDAIAFLQGHDHRHELIAGGNHTAALQAEQGGSTMKHRIAIGLDQELVRGRIA